MKRTVQSRPSKASLVARGLAAKPLKGKRVARGKKVPDNKPGYSLYSTDSEDQASSVGRGLDRCAALLTNILDSNTKGNKRKNNTENKPITREKLKSTTSAKTLQSKINATGSVAKPIVIPTASHKDQGPSTLYNERLVASTPLLNSEERKKQQNLLEREQELTRQLQQLQQHYELLQRQKSPEIQEQQKRTLQDSMLHELDGYHQNEDNMIPRQTSPSRDTPTARRSLDYNHEKNSSSEDSPEHNTSFSSTLKSTSRQDTGVKKHVRVVSPDVSERYHPRTDSRASPTRNKPVTNKNRDSLSPTAARHEVSTLQYLMRELREVLGNQSDLEVNRLMMEIDHTCSLLPYLIPSNPQNLKEDEDMNSKRLRLENSFLKRKLQSAEETAQQQEQAIHNFQQLQSGQASVTFELASCRSENASLQKQLREEKQENEKLHKELRKLEKVIENLREEKKKFIHILENKEQSHSKNRRSSQLETLRLSNEIQQLKAEVQAGKLSIEAARKEAVIVNLSLKQKDAEIERLNELTKALNQTMRRALGDIQEYTPNGINGAITASTKDLDTANHLSDVPRLKEPWFGAKQRSNSVISDTDIKGLDALQDFRLSSLFEASVNKSSMIERRNSFGSVQKDIRRQRTSPYINGSDVKSPNMSMEDPVYFSPKASLGEGVWREDRFTSPKSNDKNLELSSFSSGDEEDFQRDLASLDADIARIQRSLRETAQRSDL